MEEAVAPEAVLAVLSGSDDESDPLEPPGRIAVPSVTAWWLTWDVKLAEATTEEGSSSGLCRRRKSFMRATELVGETLVVELSEFIIFASLISAERLSSLLC